ncbi:MAG: hypothetical protein RL141_1076 [Candidatus Parcubacteria bacterium]|jgi:PAS domain S-box-containing protein
MSPTHAPDAEQEIHRLRAICAALNEGVIAVGKQGDITLANPAAATLLQTSVAQLVGSDFGTAIPLWRTGAATPCNAELMERVLHGGEHIEGHPGDGMKFHPSDGNTVWLAVSASPIMEGAATVGMVILLRDIRWEQRWEAAESQFISVASHQLRTPLTSMRWFVEMLLGGDAGAVSETQRHFLERVHSGVDRTTRLVSSLLRLSYAEVGQIRIEPISKNLNEVLAQVVQRFIATSPDHPVQATVAPECPVPMLLDEEIFERVIDVLLKNAAMYSAKGAPISITCLMHNAAIECTVQDAGVGIALAEQPRVFSRFFRSAQSVQIQPDGWGLDLVFAKLVVEAWGGRMWFTSEEGKGSRFSFSIPSQGMRQVSGIRLDVS